jgi:hypothetical protein
MAPKEKWERPAATSWWMFIARLVAASRNDSTGRDKRGQRRDVANLSPK